MMTRTTFALALSIVAVVSGCDSEVNGGGGGSGGAGSGGAGPSQVATGTGGDPSTTTNTSTAEGTGTSGPGSTGTGGTGGNTLGECTQEGGTSSGTSGGTFQCGSEFTCDGGYAEVSCSDDGTTETCECSLDGAFVGSCVDEDRSGCGFPQNCCFDLLGGHAEPNPGPYGACEDSGGSAQTSGGTSACDTFLECDGGEARISCEETSPGGLASCECLDGQGFVLGTCTEPVLDCGYESSCCHAILN